MFSLRSASGCLALCAFLGGQAVAQPLYYNTSSATQSQNRLNSVATNGSANTVLFTAGGAVSRCTSMAVDALNGKLFFIDGPSNSIWGADLNGAGPTLIKTGLNGYPTDLALDVLNQRIYFTTSSTVQSNNTVQTVGYTGAGNSIVFTATGARGNGVARCTALAVDPLNARIFFADAGASKIWSMNLAGSGLAALATTTNCFPTSLTLDRTNQRVYFTASSTAQATNLIQRVNYNGLGLTTSFTASGGVQRCTALDLDVANAVIYLSDAGANTLWRIPLGSGSAAAVLTGLPATAKKVRWFGGPSSRPAPGFTGISLSGTNVVLSAMNGFVGGTYYVLTSTNLTTPLNQWIPVLTNLLGASGSFTLTATNTASLSIRQRFYILAGLGPLRLVDRDGVGERHFV
ncbi:MAG: hypothetical protein NT154_02020 [Verrucomicrobia bacterium]|nr:hypothetical protein [Verrucomicrobiota bacterium]